MRDTTVTEVQRNQCDKTKTFLPQFSNSKITPKPQLIYALSATQYFDEAVYSFDIKDSLAHAALIGGLNTSFDLNKTQL